MDTGIGLRGLCLLPYWRKLVLCPVHSGLFLEMDMDAAVSQVATGAKKSSVWKWVGGIVMVLLVAFLWLGRSVSNAYEAAVTARIGDPPGSVAFVDVQRFKSGVVCGTANAPSGLKRFIVGVQSDVFLDDGTPTGTSVFNMTSARICRET